jgi:hypothetical protein
MFMPQKNSTPKAGRYDHDVDEDLSSDLSSNEPLSQAPGRSWVQEENDGPNADVDVELSSDLSSSDEAFDSPRPARLFSC